MILRTPTDQANLARAAHSSRTRRAAARCRAISKDMKLRREVNALCAANGMQIPYPELLQTDHFHEAVAYAAERQKAMALSPATERRGMMKALERLARSWL